MPTASYSDPVHVTERGLQPAGRTLSLMAPLGASSAPLPPSVEIPRTASEPPPGGEGDGRASVVIGLACIALGLILVLVLGWHAERPEVPQSLEVSASRMRGSSAP